MSLFKKCLLQPECSSILLSVKPRFANLIINGSKRVELRRTVPSRRIGSIAIYASAPTQSIVALAEVEETIEARLADLWSISKDNGGGLTRKEFFDYFESKTMGFAIMLKNVRVFSKPMSPSKVYEPFVAPQSFKYLTPNELSILENFL